MDVEKRMMAVENLMMGGADRADVVRALAAEGVPPRTVDDYMSRVRDRWLTTAYADRQVTRARQLRRLYRDLAAARSTSRHRDVLAYEKLITDLEGNAWNLADPPPKRPHRLTEEQLQFMVENGGRLPPGVTLDDLGDF